MLDSALGADRGGSLPICCFACMCGVWAARPWLWGQQQGPQRSCWRTPHVTQRTGTLPPQQTVHSALVCVPNIVPDVWYDYRALGALRKAVCPYAVSHACCGVRPARPWCRTVWETFSPAPCSAGAVGLQAHQFAGFDCLSRCSVALFRAACPRCHCLSCGNLAGCLLVHLVQPPVITHVCLLHCLC
jgi:hypothetical protein